MRLLARDDARRALLLERCEPGTTLVSEVDDDDTAEVVAALLPRLWRAPARWHPFTALADVAGRWATDIEAAWQRAGRPFERALVDEATRALRELAGTQDEAVVLHQDLHAGNVLRARREPGWLAIDPKPLVGERAFDVASLIRDRRDELVRDPHPGARIRRRLDRLSADLGLDRERARGWALGHALAWGFSGERSFPEMVACARWIAAAR